MDLKTKYGFYHRVNERAEKEGVSFDRSTALMDLKSADSLFDINLIEWLESDSGDFLHDFVGIHNNIDRSQVPSTNFKGFYPRFAKK